MGNKLQLAGPVPPNLRHEFVGYASFVKKMFTDAGIRGRILNKAMRKQYRMVYKYDKSTRYGVVGVGRGGLGVGGGPEGEGKAMKAEEGHAEGEDRSKGEAEDLGRAVAEQFLRMTSFGSGGRLYTYVITLDGEWRFTETGEEFSVDLLR